MAKNFNTPPVSNTHSVLTISTIVIGNICADEDLRIDGTVEGKVICKGKLILGHQSNILGDVECTSVELFGRVTGNITCTSMTILRPSSDITGDIKTQSIEIESGALFRGSCSMITE